MMVIITEVLLSPYSYVQGMNKQMNNSLGHVLLVGFLKSFVVV